ncbi:phage major capsid protein [Streptomyces daqingensis]|nr:phage major capsid protein [Streptomyces daqingensis]
MNRTGNPGILPEGYGPLVLDPARKASVAMQIATQLSASTSSLHIPRVTEDTTASWTAEAATISDDDLATDEYVVTPSKLAALTYVSNELVADSSPAALQLIGDSMGAAIASKLDAAFFGNTVTNGPSGLESVTGFAAVDAGTAFDSMDAFVDAQVDLESAGARVTAWVTTPAVAKTLLKVKQGDSSNVPLITPDVSVASGRTLLGVPLFVSPYVAADTVYGIDASSTFVVIREGMTLSTSTDERFSSDQTSVRAILRVGFGFPRPSAIAKITLSEA